MPINILHAFTDGPVGDGAGPTALVQAADGNFYGTTSSGGATNYGTFFQLTPGGVFTLLATASSAGAFPTRLVAGTDGNLYGVAGADFVRLTPTGTLTSLYSSTPQFSGTNLNVGADGNFYGVASGSAGSGISPSFDQLTPSGTFTTIQSLDSVDDDGYSAVTALLQGSDGNFYGATSAYNGYAPDQYNGAIFQVTADGTLNVLHTFSALNGYYTNADGQNPVSLVQAADGNFYGVTNAGGANGVGTFFTVTSGGAFTKLHDFTSAEVVMVPSRLVQGADGNFYGENFVSTGGISEITPAGAVTVVHTFDSATEGTPSDADPNARAAFFLARDGHFYGALGSGGTNNAGTIFEFDPSFRPGTIQFSAPTYYTTESAGSVAITVQRVGGTTGTVSVTAATVANGSAAFTLTTATLTWADGDATDKVFTVPITDMHAISGTAQFSVALTAPTGGAYLNDQNNPATVQVSDNDSPAPLTVGINYPFPDVSLVSGTTISVGYYLSDPNLQDSDVQEQLSDNGVVVDQASRTTVGNGDDSGFTYLATTPGSHVLTITATDTLGETGTSSVTINVIAPPPDDATPPATAVLTPVDGLNLAAGSSVTISFDATAATPGSDDGDNSTIRPGRTLQPRAAAAATPGASLTRVSLYADRVLVASFDGDGNQLQGALTDRPVRRDASSGNTFFQARYTLPGQDKIVNLVAVALNSFGLTSTSTVATFHSTVTTDRAPLVAITGIADDTQFPAGKAATATVTASDPDASANAASGNPHRMDASGNATLAKLAFYLNGTFLSQAASLTPPFIFSFTPTVGGKNVLHAVATDSSGLSAISEPVVVEVDASTVNLAVGGAGAAVEGGSNGVVVVSRTGDTSQPLTISYKAKGAAKAGVDYKTLTGTITIPAGAAKAKIKIKPLAGLSGMGTLKLKLQLVAPTDGSYVVGTGTVKIKLIGE